MTTHERDHERDDRSATSALRNRTHGTHVSTAGLRARGWTVGLVRQLLGEPDLLRTNPYFRSAPQTRLYRVERIVAAERSDEFRTAAAAALRRSVAARAAAARRRREVLARIARAYER